MTAINRPPPIRVPQINRNMSQAEWDELQNFLDAVASSVYLLWDKIGRAQEFTTALTDITSAGPGTPDYALQALTNTGPYGFVTADEGETLLTVVANLQARLTEVEAILK